MARGNFGRQVARAARTGGGRAVAKRNTPWSWYITMAIVVVLGVALVAWSRHEKFAPAAANKPAATKVHPTIYDHWSDAVAVDICGALQPNLPKTASPKGLYTTGDGVLQITPESNADAGNNATLGRFVKEGVAGMTLTASSIKPPGGTLHTNGQDCNGKPGKVQLMVWSSPTAASGKLYAGDPAGYHLGDNQLLTIAFEPAGAAIPKPSAEAILALLQARAKSAKTATTPTTAASTTSSSVPGGTTPTTGGAGSTTTTAAPTSTTKP
ncbi:MAG TPA: hypothetical protein VFP54_07910 [Acidimicrobiales bacterium]|nr:hypothetical protein [Acidimicrobiales bacterium]